MPEPRGPVTLIRNARLVPVGSDLSSDVAASGRPVDIELDRGGISRIGGRLRPPAGADVHDARGRWAIPGLWDHHVHMRQWALTSIRLDLRDSARPEDAARIVAEHVASLPPRRATEVVTGFGHRSAAWPRQPTVRELDAVSGGHPVVLISGDAHNGWLNSAALRLLGVPARDGPMDEAEWFEAFARLDTLPGSAEQEEAGYRAVVAAASRAGVVGIVDLEFGRGFREWPERVVRGYDTLRVRTGVYPDRLDEVVNAGLRTGDALPDGAGLVTMGSLKIISDGSLSTRTAYCREPFADAEGLEFPRGKQNYTERELGELLRLARAAGLRVAVHALGDAALTIALDAFEATGAAGSIEHAQLVAWSDIPRMARLGISASVQPAHLLDDRDLAERSWPGRTDRCFAFRSMLDAGVRLAMGSDAPVSPLDPWLGMAAAVHRTADARAPWHPEQSITAAEALAASTDGQRTLAPGNRGDVVLLDADPLAADADPASTAAALRGMRVAATFVAGRPVFSTL